MKNVWLTIGHKAINLENIIAVIPQQREDGRYTLEFTALGGTVFNIGSYKTFDEADEIRAGVVAGDFDWWTRVSETSGESEEREARREAKQREFAKRLNAVG